MNVITALPARTIPQSVAVVGSFEAIHELMFGPQQHDAHVGAHRRFIRRQKDAAFYDAADARVRSFLAEIRARKNGAAHV